MFLRSNSFQTSPLQSTGSLEFSRQRPGKSCCRQCRKCWRLSCNRRQQLQYHCPICCRQCSADAILFHVTVICCRSRDRYHKTKSQGQQASKRDASCNRTADGRPRFYAFIARCRHPQHQLNPWTQIKVWCRASTEYYLWEGYISFLMSRWVESLAAVNTITDWSVSFVCDFKSTFYTIDDHSAVSIYLSAIPNSSIELFVWDLKLE